MTAREFYARGRFGFVPEDYEVEAFPAPSKGWPIVGLALAVWAAGLIVVAVAGWALSTLSALFT